MAYSETPGGCVTALDFDETGRYLAVGLSSGEVYVFVRKGIKLSLCASFVSHESDIVSIKWCKGLLYNALLLLIANVNTIKLWKISGINSLSYSTYGQDVEEQMHHACIHGNTLPCVRITLKREYMNSPNNTQLFNLHSLSLNSDGETFMVADELRVHIWHMLDSVSCFNVINLTPSSLHLLTEVVRVAAFSPLHCYLLTYGTSTGCVRLCDLRASALCDADGAAVQTMGLGNAVSANAGLGPLADYCRAVSDLAFSPDGTYLASRDYDSIRLWDVRMTHRPLSLFCVGERDLLLRRLYDLYENGAPPDRFRCSFLSDGGLLRLVTGTYNDHCVLWDINGAHHKTLYVGKPKPVTSPQSPGPVATPTIPDPKRAATTRPKRRKSISPSSSPPSRRRQAMFFDQPSPPSSPSPPSRPPHILPIHPLAQAMVVHFDGKADGDARHDSDYQDEDPKICYYHNNFQQDDEWGSNDCASFGFGARVSALVPHLQSDTLACCASGRLFVYDYAR
jgi:serine/threonine-protein phosphatase 2A regulatory subunit B